MCRPILLLLEKSVAFYLVLKGRVCLCAYGHVIMYIDALFLIKVTRSVSQKLQAVNSSEHYFSMKANVYVGLTLGLFFFPYDMLERQFMTFDVCISVFCCFLCLG